VRDLASRRSCLVHGDFSPKNVLVGPGARLWVIDFEVAHRGDPAFDVAFMCTHLLMKSYARPDSVAPLDAARAGFLAAYADAGPAGPDLDWRHLSRLIGALLVARVKGKSPAGYLQDGARQQVWNLGLSLLREPAGSADEVTRRRDEQVR
jgi:aminoglycoside phosphotransferase (APT) family kinase protein